LKAPVLLIIFNRPETTKRVFEAIKSVRPSKLYIAADAPREGNPDDYIRCKVARQLTEEIEWPCEVHRLYQDRNLGCSMGPRTAFQWFFSQEDEGIILEDDCLPHEDFFAFSEEMLHRFRHEKRILSINGSNLGYLVKSGESYTFSRFMNMWGWATWADRAHSIDYSLSSWKKVKSPVWWLYRRLRQNIFDTDIYWYRYWQDKFDRTVNGKMITWWDWQWIFHQIEHRRLSVVPAQNLVTNIGFTQDATHTRAADNPAAELPSSSLSRPYRHPRLIAGNISYEENLKWVWCYHKRPSFMVSLKGCIKHILKQAE
ncbi:MAG TPA: hypothetical protein PKE07_15300, partial [Lacibacter sp.]|nr:hypothetical protein [Lacibacter sp.]